MLKADYITNLNIAPTSVVPLGYDVPIAIDGYGGQHRGAVGAVYGVDVRDEEMADQVDFKREEGVAGEYADDSARAIDGIFGQGRFGSSHGRGFGRCFWQRLGVWPRRPFMTDFGVEWKGADGCEGTADHGRSASSTMRK